jgi:hypothetical protein
MYASYGQASHAASVGRRRVMSVKPITAKPNNIFA